MFLGNNFPWYVNHCSVSRLHFQLYFLIFIFYKNCWANYCCDYNGLAGHFFLSKHCNLAWNSFYPSPKSNAPFRSLVLHTFSPFLLLQLYNGLVGHVLLSKHLIACNSFYSSPHSDAPFHSLVLPTFSTATKRACKWVLFCLIFLHKSSLYMSIRALRSQSDMTT